MKITILGSGSFISSLDHFGPGYLIEINGKKILIDAGQGTMIQLLKLGVKFEEIDYILLTHFHADHVADLAPLLLWRKIARRQNIGLDKTIRIYGPEGTENFIGALFKNFNDIGGDWYEASSTSGEMEIEGIKIEPFYVIHKDLKALAYRMKFGNKVLVFSGDSAECEGIWEASKNADVFIVDASLPNGIKNNIHLNSEQIGNICQENNVKKVILSHLTPWVFEKDIISEVREAFGGEIVLAKDLLEFEIGE
ncbi:MAG: ribonuclease Z [Patescibacteria group bacterium]